MLAVLIAGIGLLLAGLVTVGLGIQLDLSFGNTLIMVGAIVTCTGFILLALWIVVRELKDLARQLGAVTAAPSRRTRPAPASDVNETLGNQAPEDGGLLYGHDHPAPQIAGVEPAPQPPWQEEAQARERVVPEPSESAPAAKPRRNLLFSSSSRKERERAQTRADAAPVAPQVPAMTAPPVAEPAEPPTATFDDAWPKSERARTAEPPPPRRGRPPATEPAAPADPYSPLPRSDDQPQVTVLKSGVVDGMAYSLYSDGSIEAQMPEGMMRFASIDELRAHLDHRP